MIPIDWIYGLIGGLMIGAAAALYLLVPGRIMGASGVLGSLVDGTSGGKTVERAAFVAGLIGLPALVALIRGAPETNVTTSLPLLILGGLAVGFGTRLANGCTSGHGVCGISRLSARGIIATLAYLAAGAIAMLVLRHGLGWI